MRMELHGMSYDICHLVVASVVQALHRVQDTSLNRLQSIVDMRNRTFQNNIRSIVQKPVLVHTAQLVFYSFVALVDRLIVRMCFFIA